MTSKEFIIWLKGFITACNDYAPTPKQWDIIKEELEKVSDEPKIGTPIGQGGWGTPNVAPITPNWQHPHYPNPLDNPYKITSQPGTTLTVSSGSGGTIIATPGYGSITYNNPPFGFGSTSTAYGYPSGSAWSYTNGGNEIKD